MLLFFLLFLLFLLLLLPGSFSVNVGGPIWACHWCPQACHNNKHHHHQFFALYTHKNTREQFLIESSSSPPSSSSSDKRIIQLWDFGLLKPSNEDNAKPKSIGGCDGGEKDRSVVNLMLVEGGPVWDMKWSQGAWCCDEEEKEGEGLFEVMIINSRLFHHLLHHW